MTTIDRTAPVLVTGGSGYVASVQRMRGRIALVSRLCCRHRRSVKSHVLVQLQGESDEDEEELRETNDGDAVLSALVRACQATGTYLAPFLPDQLDEELDFGHDAVR